MRESLITNKFQSRREILQFIAITTPINHEDVNCYSKDILNLYRHYCTIRFFFLNWFNFFFSLFFSLPLSLPRFRINLILTPRTPQVFPNSSSPLTNRILFLLCFRSFMSTLTHLIIVNYNYLSQITIIVSYCCYYLNNDHLFWKN